MYVLKGARKPVCGAALRNHPAVYGFLRENGQGTDSDIQAATAFGIRI
jgi:hypothetical protein